MWTELEQEATQHRGKMAYTALGIKNLTTRSDSGNKRNP